MVISSHVIQEDNRGCVTQQCFCGQGVSVALTVVELLEYPPQKMAPDYFTQITVLYFSESGNQVCRLKPPCVVINSLLSTVVMPLPPHQRSSWSRIDISLLPKVTQDMWWEHASISVLNQKRKELGLKREVCSLGLSCIHCAHDCKDHRRVTWLSSGEVERGRVSFTDRLQFLSGFLRGLVMGLGTFQKCQNMG